ncbi:MAG: DUF3098 domain-containing protein [Sphingobacteriia bacterium]|mgnify:FL=1|nr:DUF3098 domain-containing protein [Sphingobacteriia bacterium]
MIKKNEKVTTEEVNTSSQDQFVFGSFNYKLLFVTLALIVLGFLLMIGGGSDDPKVFNEEIFGFTRMTLSPILILAGFVLGIFAIMKRPK